MATVALNTVRTRDTIILIWDTMGPNDVGEPAEIPYHEDKTVHIHGTPDGATFTMEGSNNGGISWFPLRFPERGVIALTVCPDGGLIVENPQLIRPKTSGGGVTGIQPIVCAR